MKRVFAILVIMALVVSSLVGCGDKSSSSDNAQGGKLVIGFAQIGAESGWRTVETMSIKETCEICFMGLDFVEEGTRAARWLIQNYKNEDKDKIEILTLRGANVRAQQMGDKKAF